MFQKMFIAALLVGASFSAQAADGDSEFFFQSKAGQSDVTPRVGYRMLTNKAKGAGATETKTTGVYNTGVAYEYGLSDMFAIEGALYYSSLENDSTPKVKGSGLQDPTVTLKGNTALSMGHLHFGAILGLGFEKNKIESATERNVASGGYSLAPYVGMDVAVGGGLVGGAVSYLYRMERTTDNPGVTADSKNKDGHVLGLSAFYEHFVTDMILGAAVNYRSIGEEKDSDTGVRTGLSQNITGISLYSRIPMGTFALIPRVDYDFSNSEADKWDDLTLSVAGRFTF